MKRLIIAIFLGCLAVMALTAALQAESSAAPARLEQARLERADAEESLTIARNWVSLVIYHKGHWGNSKTAQVERCQEFKRGERALGYFCPVNPEGYIIVSLYRELAPVKAYSDMGSLNPQSEGGLADLIKGGMERELAAIESQVGPLEQAEPDAVENVLEINYGSAWQELAADAASFNRQLASGAMPMNYQEGEVMLTSYWDQYPPYNNLAPMGDGGRSVVGCAATAAAQIMRHWAWPPFGSGTYSYSWDGDDSCVVTPTAGSTLNATYTDRYDWPNIPDFATVSSPTAQINAVAELNYEAGVAFDMDYGFCASGADMGHVEAGLENHLRYSTAIVLRARSNYTATNWFERLKTQFNANRPVFYRVENHFIVADGWQEVGATPTRQYHMNYGWAMSGTCQNGCNTWYTLDSLHLGGIAEECILENIVPINALGNSLSGVYGPQAGFNYRYFDRDAAGSNATFTGPQSLQFLHRIKVSSTGAVRFSNASSGEILLFSRGDETQGIRISGNGVVKLNNGGKLKFD